MRRYPNMECVATQVNAESRHYGENDKGEGGGAISSLTQAASSQFNEDSIPLACANALCSSRLADLLRRTVTWPPDRYLLRPILSFAGCS